MHGQPEMVFGAPRGTLLARRRWCGRTDPATSDSPFVCSSARRGSRPCCYHAGRRHWRQCDLLQLRRRPALRPAEGVAAPHRLAEIFTSDYSSTAYGDSSYPDYLSIRSATSSFSQLAAFQDGGVTAVKIGDTSERARASRVTADYFGTLGVHPALGRLLGPSDLAPDAPRVAVIGNDLWRRAFESDPAILGKFMTVDGNQYGIVGVGPVCFTGLDLGRRIDVWIPLVPPADLPEERGNRGFRVVARLKNGATLEDAQPELTGPAPASPSRIPTRPAAR